MTIYQLSYGKVSVDMITDAIPRNVCLVIVDKEIMFVLKASDIITAKEMMAEISPELEDYDIVFRPFIR